MDARIAMEGKYFEEAVNADVLLAHPGFLVSH